LHFIYDFMHFIDIFFGGLKKTIYFRIVKTEKNQKILTPKSEKLCQKSKKESGNQGLQTEKNARKVSFYRVFKLFVEKIECVYALYII